MEPPSSTRARFTAAARVSLPSPHRRAARACLSPALPSRCTEVSSLPPPLRSQRQRCRSNVHLLRWEPEARTASLAARQGGGSPSQVSPMAGFSVGALRMADASRGDPDNGAVVPMGMWHRPAKRHCDAAPPTACAWTEQGSRRQAYKAGLQDVG